MKKMLCFLVAVLVTLIPSFAAKIPSNATKEINISKSPQASIAIQQTAATSGRSISELTVKDLRKALGRKLSLKEKISWHFYKKHFKQDGPPEVLIRRANTNAVLGFAFSLAGLIVFPLFLIPALILSLSALRAEKVDPGILTKGNYSLANAGKIISLIAIGIYILLLGAIVLYILALG